MTAKRISEDEQIGIIWFVTTLGISQRETADVYGVSPTAVQRLVASFKKNPEKFPGYHEWVRKHIDRVVLETPELEVIPEPALDYSRVIHTPREVIQSSKKVIQSPRGVIQSSNHVITAKSGSVRDRRRSGTPNYGPLFSNERGMARWVFYALCTATVGFITYGMYRIFTS